MSYRIDSYKPTKGVVHTSIPKSFLMLDVPDGAKVFYLKLHAVADNFFGGKRQYYFNGASQEAIAERIGMKPPAFRKALRGLEAAGLATYGRNGLTLLPPEGMTLEQPIAEEEEEGREEEEEQPAIEVITPEVVTAAIDRKPAPAPVKVDTTLAEDLGEVWNANTRGTRLNGAMPQSSMGNILELANRLKVTPELVVKCAARYAEEGKNASYVIGRDGSPYSADCKERVASAIRNSDEYQALREERAGLAHAEIIEPIAPLFDAFWETFKESLPEKLTKRSIPYPQVSAHLEEKLKFKSANYGMALRSFPTAKFTYNPNHPETFEEGANAMREFLSELTAPLEVNEENVRRAAHHIATRIAKSSIYKAYEKAEPQLVAVAPLGAELEEARLIMQQPPAMPAALANLDLSNALDAYNEPLHKAHEALQSFANGAIQVLNSHIGTQAIEED